MSIVKVKYTRSRNTVKAHIRYIAHRRGRGEEAASRPLFGSEGAISKAQAYQMIENAGRATVFYKMVISPDPKREDKGRDLDLSQITSMTVQKLAERLRKSVRFIAVEHNDHTAIRHVHAVCLIQGRLTRQDFKTLISSAREEATREARSQRKARDRLMSFSPFQPLRSSPPHNRERGRGVRSMPRLGPGCRSCGFGEITGVPAYLTYCPLCSSRLGRDRRVYLSMEEYL